MAFSHTGNRQAELVGGIAVVSAPDVQVGCMGSISGQ
jgi:hypothetical protein